jgi:diacylglycerol O-acyltransferase / wax synthase
MRDPTKLLNPLRRAAPTALAFARDLLRPEVHPTATRFNTIVSPHRVFDTRRFGLAEFQRIRALVPGATVNDAVIAVCAGGLRRYLAGHAELPRADLAAIVSLDIAAERAPDATTVLIALGTSLADPLQRLAFVRDQTAAAEAALNAGQTVVESPPPACTITHVPGPTQTVYLHGARMTYFSAILPIADGMGLVFAVSGYDGRIVVSPTSCRELMPDPQVFTQGVRDSFQEFLALADAAAAPRAAPKRAARQPRRRPSAAGTPSPSGPTGRTDAKPLPAETAGRRRSTAPRH